MSKVETTVRTEQIAREVLRAYFDDPTGSVDMNANSFRLRAIEAARKAMEEERT